MGVRVLADKKHKFTILTTKPAIEASPTLVDLAAGIEACSKVLFDGFRFTPTTRAPDRRLLLSSHRVPALTSSRAPAALSNGADMNAVPAPCLA